MRTYILTVVMVFATLFGMFGCAKASVETVTTLETVSLTLRGMRGSYVYKFENTDDVTEVRRYSERYSGEEKALVLEKSAACGLQAMIDLMNTCGIMGWNGFHGKHPKNVSDGIMFEFEAVVNGGQRIYADGSANFPKGYYEFVRALDEMLAKGGVN